MRIESMKFEGLSFAHEGQDPIFDQVDFDFPMNHIVWIRAASGAGRSTLLQLMAGLSTPQKGKYLINDQNVAEMSFEEFLPYRLNIGYGFDFGGLINNRTLLENVMLPLEYHKLCSREEARERAETYFSRLGGIKIKDQRPSLVPGGMRKLTCLIRALVTEPQVLLLDDPSVGLGQEVALAFFDCIRELRDAGKAQHVYVSSFDGQLMSCLEHREIILDSGQIHPDVVEDEKKAVSL